MTRELLGGCFCGAVKYVVADSFQYAMNCHCSECRRTTGSAFKPLAGIEKHHLQITEGANSVMRFGGEITHNVHCAKCGSLLYSVVRDGVYVHVAMGTLIDEPSIQPSMHIFVASKASWDNIHDSLPQFDGFPE